MKPATNQPEHCRRQCYAWCDDTSLVARQLEIGFVDDGLFVLQNTLFGCCVGCKRLSHGLAYDAVTNSPSEKVSQDICRKEAGRRSF